MLCDTLTRLQRGHNDIDTGPSAKQMKHHTYQLSEIEISDDEDNSDSRSDSSSEVAEGEDDDAAAAKQYKDVEMKVSYY